MHCTSFDTFWEFCAGMMDGSAVYADPSTVYAWDGQRRFSHGVETGEATGERLRGGFLHVIVHETETPKRIQIDFYEGNA